MPHPIRLFNTASRTLEDFQPHTPTEVRLYACGPTVYHYAHIGNMRTYVFEDLLRRTLRHAGYAVKHVMNITDVGHLQSDADSGDDKMSLAAQREARSPWDIAAYYEEAFFRHAELLNIERPDIVCRATDHIAQMIDMVQRLQQQGYAYEVDGNVYFEVAKFDRYCDFAGLNLEAQSATERVEADPRKRSQTDFALWFSQSKYPNQIMKWDSPWGIGFPGWHIECSAMASHYLGDQIDIHCGGIDHIPVHHTNEIAQSECCFGKRWVRYWLHGAFLNVDNGKMSKSKGDTLTVDTLIQDGFDPMDYRYLLLTAHYRSELRFSYEALQQARNTLHGLRERIREALKTAQPAEQLDARAQHWQTQFFEPMREDLHTPRALSTLWGALRDDTLDTPQRLALLQEFDEVLGLQLFHLPERQLTDEQQAMLDQRAAARARRDWAESDRLRDALLAQGIQVKDSKQGTDWTFVQS